MKIKKDKMKKKNNNNNNKKKIKKKKNTQVLLLKLLFKVDMNIEVRQMYYKKKKNHIMIKSAL